METKLPPTVGEVIDFLRTLPPDTRVVVRGYEDGFDSAETKGMVLSFKKYHPPAHYFGEWDDCRGDDVALFKAVQL